MIGQISSSGRRRRADSLRAASSSLLKKSYESGQNVIVNFSGIWRAPKARVYTLDVE
jgi:hypothetical protein